MVAEGNPTAQRVQPGRRLGSLAIMFAACSGNDADLFGRSDNALRSFGRCRVERASRAVPLSQDLSGRRLGAGRLRLFHRSGAIQLLSSEQHAPDRRFRPPGGCRSR